MAGRLLILMTPFAVALRPALGKEFARAGSHLKIAMSSSFGPATTTGEIAARARLAGPWRRTIYELYDWVSPIGITTEGNVQDEQVERATLEQQCALGVALSSVAEAAWPRDDFMTGATLEFSFGPPPLGPLSMLSAHLS